MAIPILNHMDFHKSGEIRNVRLHNQASSGVTSPGTGQILYDSGTVKYYNGSSWISLGSATGDITRVNITAGNGLSGTTVDTTSGDHTQTLTVGAGDGITVNSGDVAVTAAQTTITSVLNTSLKVGRSATTEYIDFATDNIIKLIANGGEARWNGSAFVPGSDGDKDLGSSSKEWNDLYIDGTANIDALAMGVTVTAINDTDNFSDASATTLATSESIKAYVDGKTYDDVSIANLKTKLAGGFGSNAVTIGDSDDVVTIGNDLVITGDLTVSGDTISANVATLNVEDKNITLNYSSGDSSSTAGGSGITIQDAVNSSTDATILWDASNDEFDFSHAINITGTITASGNITGNLVGNVTGTADQVANNLTVDNTTIQLNSGTTYNGGAARTISAKTAAIADGGTGLATADQIYDHVTSRLSTEHAAKNKSFELDNNASGVASSDNITYTITHGMGASRLYKVEVIEDSGNYETVYVEVQRPSDTTIKIIFASAVTAGAYRALITKI